MCKPAVIDIKLQSAWASFVGINTSGHPTHSFYTGIMKVGHSPSLLLTLADITNHSTDIYLTVLVDITQEKWNKLLMTHEALIDR